MGQSYLKPSTVISGTHEPEPFGAQYRYFGYASGAAVEAGLPLFRERSDRHYILCIYFSNTTK